MFKRIFANKKMNLAVFSLFAFLLLMFVFIIFVNNKEETKNVTKELSSQEIKEVIDAGNFVSKDLRLVDQSDIFISGKKPKVNIIIYEDLSNYYSAEFNETIDYIKKDFGDKILIAFRPYADKMYPNSIEANLWSQCAREQGKFFEFRDFLLQQAKNDNFSEDNYINYAKEINLDINGIDICLKNSEKLAQLEKIKNEAENFDVYGVPTIFVGSEMIVGSRSYDNSVNGSGEKLEGMRNIISRHLNN